MRCEDCIHEKVCEGYSNCEEAGLCEPKRPHGEWITCKDDNFCKCSVCMNIVMCEELSNFCPDCGADMRPKEGGHNDF